MRVAGSKPLLNAQIMDQSVIGKSTTTTTNYLPWECQSIYRPRISIKISKGDKA